MSNIKISKDKLQSFKLNKFTKIQNLLQTEDINESGYYSLIFRSKMDQSIIFTDHDTLKKFLNKNVVYLLHIKNSLYKFDYSSNFDNQLECHKIIKIYNKCIPMENKIIKIYECNNINECITMENKIKDLIKLLNINTTYNGYTEIFKYNNINNIIKFIDSYHKTDNKLDTLMLIEHEKTKQLELQLELTSKHKKTKLELECEKTKQLELELECEKTKQLELELECEKTKLECEKIKFECEKIKFECEKTKQLELECEKTKQLECDKIKKDNEKIIDNWIIDTCDRISNSMISGKTTFKHLKYNKMLTITMDEMNNYLISKYNKIILKYERCYDEYYYTFIKFTINNSEIISLK